jgi:GTP 3',8-cyclase
MPEEGIRMLRHEDILSYSEIEGFTRVAVKNGIKKVRITGGEPLVRKGIVSLIRMISPIDGIKDLSMTTNGILLKEYAADLKNAGLHRVNISLDTTNPGRFSYLTRGGNIDDVMDGIKAANDTGLLPVKINCVILDSPEEEDAKSVTLFCRENNLEIRYIRQMDLVRGHFSTVVGGIGGNCPLCNRLRLTSDGKLKPCLFNDIAFDIRETGYEEAFKKAVDLKPECGSNNLSGEFYNIGG